MRSLLDSRLLELGPAIVGATGGSGTRVVARVLRRAGFYVGTELNESEDAWKLGDYSDRWINTYLSRRGGALPGEVETAMLGDLSEALRDHCAPIGHEPRRWGWKEPRCIYLLPFFHRHLPALRFLHVVRDGRDMALSQNQNQLRKHGDAAPIPTDLAPAERSIALWSWVNLEAKRYGEERLGNRYLRVRFEDLCERPAEVVAPVLRFLELEGDPHALAEEVTPPPSLGRWRSADAGTIGKLERVAGAALSELGYASGYP
jgi:hypothetical protein